jgi:quinol monooxygenase YgiN
MAQDAVPVTLVERFTVRPGCEAHFDQLTALTAAGVRAHEPGTLVYTCHAVSGVSRQRVFYELYRDKAAFADHQAQPHTRRFLAKRGALLESAEADFLDLTDGKLPAASSTLRATSGSWEVSDE